MFTTYLYIHGFNSDGDGWKARALQRHFPDACIISPDFPADPLTVVHQQDGILKDLNPQNTLLMGTSLGGFYAYLSSAKYNIPAYLFNPSLAPFYTLNDRGIGQFYTWTKKRSYFFSPDYLSILSQLKQTADKTIRPSNLSFFLATDDELLDHSQLNKQYPKACFQWYDGAGHSFSKFEKVLKEMRKMNENVIKPINLGDI